MMGQNRRDIEWILPGLYLASRLWIAMIEISGGMQNFGDLGVYYDFGNLQGWPFFNYWVEYPPLFAFLNKALYLLAVGDRTLFYLLFLLVLALSGAVCLVFFQRMAIHLYGFEQGLLRSLVFFGLLAALPYTWWYFDILPLAFLLVGIEGLLGGRPMRANLSLGLGMLAKWFPGLALAAVLRYRSKRVALRTMAISLGMVVMVVAALWLASPTMTAASLASQPARTSWQTVWAYLDGNRVSGYFAAAEWRYDPLQAYVPRGNPAVIPPPVSLVFFAALGLFFFWRVKNLSDRSLIAFIGITFAVFWMWSPGWSPQWVLYLLPLILLTLPVRQAGILAVTLLVVVVFEWPFALSQYWFRGVFAMAGLRMLIFAALIFLWYRITQVEPLASEGSQTTAPL